MNNTPITPWSRTPAPVTRADGRPAYVGAPPRITATMVREYGSYQAARNALGEGRGNEQ